MDNPFDPTLTLKNVVKSLRAVIDWEELGIQLEIEYYELEKIRIDRRNIDPCKREMVRWWLKHGISPSWQKLCDALKDLQQECIANQIVSEYPELKRRVMEKEAREAEILCSNPYPSLSLEDSKHEQRSRDWELRNEQIQHEHEERMESAQQAAFAETTSENVEKTIRDLFHKQKIGWVYDALKKSAVDREELELLKERMEVQAE